MDEQRQPAAEHWAFSGHPEGWRDAEPVPASAPPYPYEGDLPTPAGTGPQASVYDDRTPHSGMMAPVEPPPLWREAARYSPGYDPQHDQQQHPSPSLLQPPRLSVVEDSPEDAGYDPQLDWAGGADQEMLPKRVPSEPDLPQGVADADVHAAASGGVQSDPGWTAPELARIVNELRRDDVPREAPPVDEFDVDEVLAAVRMVEGVRDASLRADLTGIHTLRLDLSDDADPVHVSRVVARMLSERMGFNTAPQQMPPAHRRPEREPAAAEPALPSPDPVPPPPSPAPPPPSPAPAPAPPAPPPPAPAPAPPAPPPPAPAPPPPAPPPPAPPPPAPPPPAPGAHSERGEPELAEPSPEEAAEALPRPLPPPPTPGVRVVIDNVQVNMFGLDATVEVRLAAGGRRVLGLASGPAVDGYVTRLAAVSAAKAIDQLLREVDPRGDAGRCFVEHTGVVPFGSTEVVVVVVQLVCQGWVEQLAGCAVVSGDPRRAVVRATLGAVNRRLEALLS